MWKPPISGCNHDKEISEFHKIHRCCYNQYWTMWKLSMYGCSHDSQMLEEIAEFHETDTRCKNPLCFSFLELASFSMMGGGAEISPTTVIHRKFPL